MNGNLQYIREASLIILNADNTGLDLSELHFQFSISAAELMTPAACQVRVFNLGSRQVHELGTANNKYLQLVLQVGYKDGPKGVIFKGTIVQIISGRVNSTDSYLDIVAFDGDLAINFSVVNKTLEAGITNLDQVNALHEAMQKVDATIQASAPVDVFTSGVLPRGKVLYGMSRDYARSLANTTLSSASVRNGVLTFTQLDRALDNQAVTLTAKTGLIGLPEQTNNGILATCLINPLIVPGIIVKIDESVINQEKINLQYTGINLIAPRDVDGLYKVVVVEYQGDTRGENWYQYLTCLAIHPDKDSIPRVNINQQNFGG